MSSSGASTAIARPKSPSAVNPLDVASTGRPQGSGAAPRRRAVQTAKPNSTRAAGAGGSSQTMLRLYTGDGEGGLKVDPYVVVVLSVAFIFSVFLLHIFSKVVRWATR